MELIGAHIALIKRNCSADHSNTFPTLNAAFEALARNQLAAFKLE
jgi:hypothetical protein